MNPFWLNYIGALFCLFCTWVVVIILCDEWKIRRRRGRHTA